MLTEHGITISPSTYYARSAAPSTAAELADAYAANEVFCLFHDRLAPEALPARRVLCRPTIDRYRQLVGGHRHTHHVPAKVTAPFRSWERSPPGRASHQDRRIEGLGVRWTTTDNWGLVETRTF